MTGMDAAFILAAIGFLPLLAGGSALIDDADNTPGKWVLGFGVACVIPMLSRLVITAVLS